MGASWEGHFEAMPVCSRHASCARQRWCAVFVVLRGARQYGSGGAKSRISVAVASVPSCVLFFTFKRVGRR